MRVSHITNRILMGMGGTPTRLSRSLLLTAPCLRSLRRSLLPAPALLRGSWRINRSMRRAGRDISIVRASLLDQLVGHLTISHDEVHDLLVAPDLEGLVAEQVVAGGEYLLTELGVRVDWVLLLTY